MDKGKLSSQCNFLSDTMEALVELIQVEEICSIKGNIFVQGWDFLGEKRGGKKVPL